MKPLPLLSSLPFLVIASSLSAENILINFGSTAYTGTNAPGHADGGLTGTSWNPIWDDTSSGILDQNGLATDISIDFGTATSADCTTMSYSGTTKSLDFGTLGTSNPGFVARFDTGLGKSSVTRTSGSTIGVGLAMSGLDAGEYEFYVTTFRGDHSSNATLDFDIYAGVSSAGITDYSSYAAETIVHPSTLAY